MIVRLPSFGLMRLAAALLLATIGLQAAAPAVAIERTHGSAFSAATYEVAVLRRADMVQIIKAPQPLAPVPFVNGYGLAVRFDAPGPRAPVDVQTLPAPEWRHWLPQPRAPPAS